MSKEQMEIHDEDLLGIDETKKSVLSSCFSTETMLRFESLANKNKSDKYAIIDGQGGWHTQAKGINESIKHAEEKRPEVRFDQNRNSRRDARSPFWLQGNHNNANHTRHMSKNNH